MFTDKLAMRRAVFQLKWAGLALVLGLSQAFAPPPATDSLVRYSDRFSNDEIVAREHPDFNIRDNIQWNNVKPAQLEFLAQIVGVYGDRDIYINGRGMEEIERLAHWMGVKNVHIVNVSRDSVSDPHLKDYLAEKGPSVDALRAGRKAIFIDDSFSGSLMNQIVQAYPEDVRDKLSAHFLVSKVSKEVPLAIPSSRSFLFTLDARRTSEDADIVPAQMGYVATRYSYLPKGTKTASGYQYSPESGWDAVSLPQNAGTRTRARQMLEDLKFYAQKSETKNQFQKQLQEWRELRSIIDRAEKQNGKITEEGRQTVIAELKQKLGLQPRPPIEEARVRDFLEMVDKNFPELELKVPVDGKKGLGLTKTFDPLSSEDIPFARVHTGDRAFEKNLLEYKRKLEAMIQRAASHDPQMPNFDRLMYAADRAIVIYSQIFAPDPSMHGVLSAAAERFKTSTHPQVRALADAIREARVVAASVAVDQTDPTDLKNGKKVLIELLADSDLRIASEAAHTLFEKTGGLSEHELSQVAETLSRSPHKDNLEFFQKGIAILSRDSKLAQIPLQHLRAELELNQTSPRGRLIDSALVHPVPFEGAREEKVTAIPKPPPRSLPSLDRLSISEKLDVLRYALAENDTHSVQEVMRSLRSTPPMQPQVVGKLADLVGQNFLASYPNEHAELVEFLRRGSENLILRKDQPAFQDKVPDAAVKAFLATQRINEDGTDFGAELKLKAGAINQKLSDSFGAWCGFREMAN